MERIRFANNVGYYLQKDLDEVPFPVNKSEFQLDKDLIRRINHSENGYTLTGSLSDFHLYKSEYEIYRDTRVLESYVNSERGYSNMTLRIFARGGSLCDFLLGTGITPVSTLEFDYDEAANILRLIKPKLTWDIRNMDYTKIGQARLTGDTDELIEYGRKNVYKVLEVVTDDYELFYSKEVDCFDGDEDVEIRGIIEDFTVKGPKVLYRSCALASIYKLALLIVSTEDNNLIKRVSIIDDFRKHAFFRKTVEEILFGELYDFFKHFVQVMQFFKKGTISKGVGGIIVLPEGCGKPKPAENVLALYQEHFDSELRKLFGLRSHFLNDHPLEIEGKSLVLCLESPDKLLELARKYGQSAIVAGFIDYYRNPQKPWKKVLKNYDYYDITYFWRKTVEEICFDLLHPFRLHSDKMAFTATPFIARLQLPNEYHKANNNPWWLSIRNNILIAEKLKDVNRLLDTLFVPLPELPGVVPMTVYCQQECQGVLSKFFGNQIVFEAPFDKKEKVIHCRIVLFDSEKFYQKVFEDLGIKLELSSFPHRSSDLYLMGKNGRMTGGYVDRETMNFVVARWENKHDLQLVNENFKELDPIRKFPKTITLFSHEADERTQMTRMLARTHEPSRNYVYSPEELHFTAIDNNNKQ